MSGMKSRNRYSLFNAVSAMLQTLINGLLGIVVTRFVIEQYGSDFNGINSTANQIINVLLILEGGFTMASNVALFAPLTEENYGTVNGILSATRKKFRRIGLLFLGIGTLVSVGYGFFANSDLPAEFVATVIMMTVVPAAFNLFYTTTYRVLLQTQQKEYIINLVTAFTLGLGHAANIVMILLDGPMWMVRFNTMVCALLNSLLIAWYVKKRNPFLNLKAAPMAAAIKGTGDVMAQRITGVVYSSAPIVFLSISPTGGTVLASVYAVYNNVFTMLKSLLHAVIDAPRLSIGQLLTERKREDVWPVFKQYEYMAFFAIFTLMTTCCTLILPFINIYTEGITDANYYDFGIAILMILIAVMEMIHIPSGHLINMAGEFRISKIFQIISCIVLTVSMSVGGMLFGVYGMLFAILTCAVLLAILEMGYVHICFFRKKLPELFMLLLPMGVVGVLICWLELQLSVTVSGYVSFMAYGVLFVAVNAVVAVLVGLLFNRREFLSLVRRVLGIFARRS